MLIAERAIAGWWRRVHNSQTQLTVCMMLYIFVPNFNTGIVILGILYEVQQISSYFQCGLVNVVYDLQLSVRTKAGMTSAAESITDSLRRTRQLMVQVSSYGSSCRVL